MAMLGFAIVNFGISPTVFWAMTMLEYVATQKAWLLSQGFGEKPDADKMTRDEYEAMKKA